MANIPPQRDLFSNDEDYQLAYDQWAYDITQEMNTAVAGAATTDIDNQGRVVIDNTPVGYRFRYLDTAYGSDINGADFATTPSVLPAGTTPVYQGVRNAASSVESTNPADFTWREINSIVLSQDLRAFYRNIGGRDIDWIFGNATAVAGFVEDLGAASIDLDNLPGAAGADGNSAGVVEIFIRAATAPSAPADTTDYNTADGTFTVPTNWVTTPDATTGTSPIYSSKANFFGVGTVTLDWSTPVRFEGTDVTVTSIADGAAIFDGVNTVNIANGAPGINSAVVNLFQASTDNATAPTLFSGDFTYTFSTGLLSGGTLNGWTQDLPDVPQGSFLWQAQAVASNAAATDTVPASEFSTPVLVSASGLDGVNVFIVELYQVSTDNVNAPADPTGSFRYTFSTNMLDVIDAADLNGWTQTIPNVPAGSFLWTIQAAASSRGNTDDIASSEFSAAVIVSGVGQSGTSAFNGSISFSSSNLFTQNVDATWPTRSSIAIVTFTDGTTTVDETYTVNVDSSGVPTGVIGSVDTSITVTTELNGRLLTVTWTHSDGASITATFEGRARPPRSRTIQLFRSIADTSVPAVLTTTELDALSYNFVTGVLSNVPMNWQITPAEITINNTTELFYSYEILVSEDEFGGSQTFTNIDTPVARINFGNDIQSDNFATGESGWRIERDTGNAEFANVTARGDIIARGLEVNSIVTNTLRSGNYVAPTLNQNPPNSGYSLEHVEGIGFFEELRANLIGTVTAPATTPTAGVHTYNTSAVTRQYLDVTVGDAMDTYTLPDENGTVHTFRRILSNPVWDIELPTSPEVVDGIGDTWAGRIRVRASADYEWYYNLSVNDINQPGFPTTTEILNRLHVGWVVYGTDDAGNFVGGPSVSLVSGSALVLHTLASLSDAAIITSTPVSTANVIESLGATFPGGSIQATAEIPTRARMYFALFFQVADDVFELTTSPISITAGIQANSAIQFTVNSVDGSSSTTNITQGAA